MVLVDSDFLVAVLRDDPSALNTLDALEASGERITTTVINVFELLEGALLHHNANENVKFVDQLLNSIDLYAFTEMDARAAAQIVVTLKKQGEVLDFQDIAIAAIAIINEETMISRNVKHFKRIKGLKIKEW